MTEPAPQLEPYVAAPEPVAVRVNSAGVGHDGTVNGWRGDRIFLSYRGETGRHLKWVPAADVERA